MTLQDEHGAKSFDRFEIVKGEVVPLMPTGDVNGYVESRVAGLFTSLEDAGLGLPFGGEVGIVVEQDPRTVRGADGAFLLLEQLPHKTSSEGYLLTPPALVVEVVSPNDTASEIETKVEEYLTAGVRVVWVVYPRNRSVTVRLSDRTARTLRGEDALMAPGLFELAARVSALFKGLDRFESARGPQPPA